MKALIYITIFLTSGIWFTSCKASHNIETQKQIDYSGDIAFLLNPVLKDKQSYSQSLDHSTCR